MGILVLISGPNNSGKSAFAEKIAGNANGEKYYIATMIPSTDDNFLRIKKHRQQRDKYGFFTLELPNQVSTAPVTSNSTVLLEDVSNLLANGIFGNGSDADSVFQDICQLLKRCRAVIAVTISVSDSGEYDEETAEYIKSLHEINQKLFNIADIAITMRDNVPVYQKGEPYDFY
ncbi:MAG: bifunctional adenosylcobinamide kinase/adenosylcobinamide-phosphate guanylyltransferase [Clostridia bacterium]|nr:bifunctional adenosylcobinamide kinase/adenosylcobinamide-phosphate guanylyltransferase [Clostridia bacterium]